MPVLTNCTKIAKEVVTVAIVSTVVTVVAIVTLSTVVTDNEVRTGAALVTAIMEVIFVALVNLFDTMNHLVSVTHEGIKGKFWLSTTLGSTYSWGKCFSMTNLRHS